MNRITINGKTYSGKHSVSVVNSRVVIDGVEITDKDLPSTVLLIQVEGTLGELKTDASVNCDNITGSVEAGGSVNCDRVSGDVNAGGSVNCDDVGGNVTAGGSVIHG